MTPPDKPSQDRHKSTIAIRVHLDLAYLFKAINRVHREQERRIARLEGRPVK
jgi:hypothetical protein